MYNTSRTGGLATITPVPTAQDIVFRVALAIPHGTGVEDLVAPQIFIGLKINQIEKRLVVIILEIVLTHKINI